MFESWIRPERNRALALVRYGAVLRNQSKLDESGTVLTEAVGVLNKLQEEGDRSEATTIGLGMGLVTQARVESSRNKRSTMRGWKPNAPTRRRVDFSRR